jgi:hypothetical protein
MEIRPREHMGRKVKGIKKIVKLERTGVIQITLIMLDVSRSDPCEWKLNEKDWKNDQSKEQN